MSSEEYLVSHQDQFRSKKAARITAAAATIEEKIEKLIQLQRISCELARQAGRQAKEPWQIQISNSK